MNARAARAATMGVLGLNGFLLGMWIVSIPTIKTRTSIDQATLGLLLLVLGGSAWLGMQFAGRCVDRFSSSRVLTVSAALLACCIPTLAWATDATTLAAALAIVGFANGFVDVAQNAQAVVVERAYGRPLMSSFHAFFSLGGLMAAAAGAGLFALDVPLSAVLTACCVVGLAVALGLSNFYLPDPARVDHQAGPKARAPWTPQLALLGALAFALFLGEGVAYDWSTVHLRDSLEASTTVAALAYGAFSLTMTVVRLFADRLVLAWGPATYVARAATVGAIGLACVAIAPTPAWAIAAWALFGVGLAGCIPQFFSAAGNIDPAAAGVYLARVTSLGYLGLLAGPSVIGLMTHWVDLTTAFAVPLAGCLLAALCARRALTPATIDT